jgi:protein-tyrosine sulfotransferase
MKTILDYLELPWSEEVMHHENFINKPGGVSLSKVERSSDQVIKPVNAEALTKWVGAIPDDVLDDMPTIAPMLETLGYDPRNRKPTYGEPDAEVATNTNDIIHNHDKWSKTADDVLKQSKRKV